MLFRRKSPEGFLNRTRTYFWPRRSFGRSARYFSKRVLRISGTPHAVAAGVAAGVFASFLPYPGFHFLLAAVLAWICAGNLIASAIGTAVGNPLTFPLIWGSTYEAGRFILEGRGPRQPREMDLIAAFRRLDFGQLWEPLLKPMTVGAIPLGLAFALIFYFLTRWATVAFRNRRQKRLAEKARMKAASAPQGGQAAGA
jgi:uncharacterized protein